VSALLVKALIATAVGALLFLYLLFWPRSEVFTLTGAAMGTQWQVQLVTERGGKPGPLADDIAMLLQRLDLDVFSTWAPDSELNRFNRAAAGEPFAASADLLAVLQVAMRIYEASDRAFDPSVGPLVDIWGFGPPEVSISPDAAAISDARARLGMEELQLDVAGGSISKPDRVQLDLSGIAKGYAVDQVAGLLQARGFTDFLVELGGELRLQGRQLDDQPWTVAIERPEPGMRAVQALIDSKGQAIALAGSGDYRNYRLVEGVRQSHEIDPLSGVPVQHGLAAVTVLADSAMEADAWATALMVLGPRDGRRVADRLGLSAYFIIRAGEDWQVETTGRFTGYLVDAEPMNQQTTAAEG
jgi:thiamine biosynthesis lipoprotein